MSKRKNMQGYRRRLRNALKSAGENAPTQIGHGKQTGWKHEWSRSSFVDPALREID